MLEICTSLKTRVYIAEDKKQVTGKSQREMRRLKNEEEKKRLLECAEKFSEIESLLPFEFFYTDHAKNKSGAGEDAPPFGSYPLEIIRDVHYV